MDDEQSETIVRHSCARARSRTTPKRSVHCVDKRRVVLFCSRTPFGKRRNAVLFLIGPLLAASCGCVVLPSSHTSRYMVDDGDGVHDGLGPKHLVTPGTQRASQFRRGRYCTSRASAPTYGRRLHTRKNRFIRFPAVSPGVRIQRYSCAVLGLWWWRWWAAREKTELLYYI